MRILLVACALSALTAHAQERPFASRGDVAAVGAFSQVDLIRLPPTITAVGARYWVTDRVAVGTTVGLNASSLDAGGDGGMQSSGVRLDLWGETHVGRRSRAVSPFVGAGVRGARHSSSQTRQDFTCSDPVLCPLGQPGHYAFQRIGYGAGVLAGVEVRLLRGLTLGGAYTLGVDVGQAGGTFTPDGGQPRTVFKEDRISLQTGATNMHLSIYF